MPVNETPGARTLYRVKIGLILPQGFFNEFEEWPADRAWQRMLAIARLAESLGFDSLWTGEHVLARWGGTSPAFDCFTIGSALAATVPRVGIGFIVLNSTFRNPVLTAKAAATLDAVSGGRLILGLGAGFIEAEAQALGTPFPPLPERLRMLEEHFAIVSHLTSAGRAPLSFEGRYARADGAVSHPHGVQHPHIPLLIGGHGPKFTYRIAARYCDEININVRPSQLPQALEQLHARCAEIDRDPATLAVAASVLPTWPYRGLRSTGGQRMSRQEDLRAAGMMTDLATLPSRAEEIATWRDLGVARLMCGIPGLANTDETMYEFLEDCQLAGIELTGGAGKATDPATVLRGQGRT
jgi:alkanesulfonate monooxygenase SsuD/methylene tetrahydromethanopterin reductase-like flavin-dependent oxidoreductase (luciferase family)